MKYIWPISIQDQARPYYGDEVYLVKTYHYNDRGDIQGTHFVAYLNGKKLGYGFKPHTK